MLAAKWYVDGSTAQSGDGTTWGTAFKTIQEGIDAASRGDTVTVAQWRYYENIWFKGPNIILTSTDPRNSLVRGSTIIDGNRIGTVVTFSGEEDETCVLTGFTIRNGVRSTGWVGGGCRGKGTHATIECNLITSNLNWGGGWGGLSDCHGTIQYNTIVGNTARDGGGLYMCNGTIQNNIIMENRAYRHGGGLYGCSGAIRSNLIVGNTASWWGGGLFYCNGWVENNTIVQNHASSGGGLFGGTGAIRNCVIWANAATPSVPQIYYLESTPTYCCIQDWAGGGEGNTSLAPVFADPDGADNDPNTYDDNNYRFLKPFGVASSCIDTGDNEPWMLHAVDLDGNRRVFCGGDCGEAKPRVDMGAYEYRSFKFNANHIEQLALMTQLTWNSRPGDTYIVWSSRSLRPGFVGTWTTEAEVASGGEITTWADHGVTSSQKFYRVELK